MVRAMSENDLGPERLTAKSLPTGRRGYKKSEVERLLRAAAEAWSRLAAEHDKVMAEIERVGGLEWLARDLGAVGGDVGQILADAQTMAEGLRSRARADSTARLEAAVAAAEEMLAEAGEQAFYLRKDAWETASRLLDQAVATAEAVIENTEAEVLVERAQAEQEAHRLVQSAKRQAQDIVRAARFDGDRLLSEAHAMAGSLVSSTAGDTGEVSREVPAPDAEKTAETEVPATPAGVRVIQKESKKRRPSTGPPQTPDPGLYGDALAAEVEALHETGEQEVVPPAAPEPEVVSVEEEKAAEPAEQAAEPTGEGQPEVTVVEEATAEERAEDAVDELFSRLRGGAVAIETSARAKPQERHAAAEAAPVEVAEEGLDDTRPDPLEVRERLLLPVQNPALREVKRALLDLQNEALAALRVSGAWHPDVDNVGDALGPVLEDAVGGAAEAGADAVAELGGGDRPSAVITARTSVMAALMAEDLCTQLDDAFSGVERAGPVEASSLLSQVFRAWRSDEAERWVRTVTYAAYHDSLLAGLSLGGVELVEGVAHGRLCEECPAAKGESWDPGGDPPEGTAPPPAHLDCTCTVMPRS
jgi:cell division septum initiation protein DivIVA